MLSKAQEKIILSLHTKKGRQKHGLCLVEGPKNLVSAKKYLEFTFTEKDSPRFEKLSTTQTPQKKAGVARIPSWTEKQVMNKKTIVVLDGVQDPGNVGTILRLCLAFDAGLLLVESGDPTNPKTVRSSAGAVFLTPWIQMRRPEAESLISSQSEIIYLLEAPKNKTDYWSPNKKLPEKIFLVAGSEGQGILMDIKGKSLSIKHSPALESLNVSHALAILLSSRY